MNHQRLLQIESLLAEGKLEQARSAAQRLAQSHPRDPAAALLLSRAHHSLGELTPALHHAERAAALAPREPMPLLQQAGVLLALGRKTDAAHPAQAALALAAPGSGTHLDALLTLAGCFLAQGTPSRAEPLLRQALALDPASIATREQLAACVLALARPHEAADLSRAIADERPDDPRAQSNLCFALNYDDRADTPALIGAFQRYGSALARAMPAPRADFPNAKDPHKRLRVAIISPDLRAHAVAFFIEPFFEGHDPRAVELCVYATNAVADHVTQRLRAHASIWRQLSVASDRGIADAIARDACDIAIELSGHTEAHCLPALQYRAAPVQATYLGYPASTGVPAIDARLVDSLTDPAPESDALASESLQRLDPCFLCYRPPATAPLPAPAPSTRLGYVTFGSFNHAPKLSPTTLSRFAAVLHAVPRSRLILKSIVLADEGLRTDLLARFAALGIDSTRIDLLGPRETTADHLAAYADVDIALDTFPYAGTTTTCEALWMGVPVITCAGDRHASRVGVSLLTAAGLPELIARGEQDFIARAASLAGDEPRRLALRRSLRDQLAASPLRDEGAYCRRFESALRTLWQRWCASPR